MKLPKLATIAVVAAATLASPAFAALKVGVHAPEFSAHSEGTKITVE